MSNLSDQSINTEQLKKEYSLKYFVETGCYLGQGLELAKQQGYEKLISCDINNNYVSHCKQHFPDAEIVHSHSVYFLNSVLPSLSGPTLFWLDAHYPKYYGLENEQEGTRFPLIEEAKLICQHKKNYQNDVIICDDLRVLSKENNVNYDASLDQYFMSSHSINELISLFDKTHYYRIENTDTGVIIFTPKKKQVVTRFIINRQNAKGDVLLVEPIVRHLHKVRQGKCIIDVCTSPHNYNAIDHSPFVNKVVNSFNIFDYDIMINLDSVYEKHPHLHIVDAYADIVFGGNHNIDKIPSIFTTQEDREVADYLVNNYGDYITLHMRNSHKQLDSRNIDQSIWKNLISLILERTKLNVVVLGTNYDYFFADQSNRVIDMREKANLKQLKEIIVSSKAFIGADSLLSHIASSTSVPLFTFYTSADAESRVSLERKNTYPILANIECYGCRKNNTPPVFSSSCKRQDVECTRRFDPNEIFEILNKKL